LPVTIAETEHVFPKVDRTATAATALMDEDHLESQVLIHAHHDRTPSSDDITDRFAATDSRRLLELQMISV